MTFFVAKGKDGYLKLKYCIVMFFGSVHEQKIARKLNNTELQIVQLFSFARKIAPTSVDQFECLASCFIYGYYVTIHAFCVFVPFNVLSRSQEHTNSSRAL